jgi:hypothetical protein
MSTRRHSWNWLSRRSGCTAYTLNILSFFAGATSPLL